MSSDCLPAHQVCGVIDALAKDKTRPPLQPLPPSFIKELTAASSAPTPSAAEAARVEAVRAVRGLHPAFTAVVPVTEAAAAAASSAAHQSQLAADSAIASVHAVMEAALESGGCMSATGLSLEVEAAVDAAMERAAKDMERVAITAASQSPSTPHEGRCFTSAGLHKPSSAGVVVSAVVSGGVAAASPAAVVTSPTAPMPSMGRSSSAASLLADGSLKEHLNLLGAPPPRPVAAPSPPRAAPSPPQEARIVSFPYPPPATTRAGATLHGAASTPALVPAAALHGAASSPTLVPAAALHGATSSPALMPAADGRVQAGRAYVFSSSPPSAGRSRTTYAAQTHYAGGGGSSPFHRSMVASTRPSSSTQLNGSQRLSMTLVSPPMIGNTEDVIAASSAAAEIASAAAAAAEAAASAASAAVADVEAMLREGRKSIEMETQLRMEVLLQQARNAVEACIAPSPPPPPPPPLPPQPPPPPQPQTFEEEAPITAPNLEALSRAKSQARARAEALQRETALVEERARLLALQMRSLGSAALDQV